ncbi:1912_t:CDS:1, partial [Dentiscutata erythropus]
MKGLNRATRIYTLPKFHVKSKKVKYEVKETSTLEINSLPSEESSVEETEVLSTTNYISPE